MCNIGKGVQTKIQNTKSEKLHDALESAEKLISSSDPVKIFWKGNSKLVLQVTLN